MADLTASSSTQLRKLRLDNGVLEISIDGGVTWTTAGGGSVTTDSTLTGAGTGPSPLGINPVAARSPDWYHYMSVLFQQKTGLSPIDIQEQCRDNIGIVQGGIAAPSGNSFLTNGAGATVARDGTQAGAYKMVGAAGGSAEWSEDWGTSVNFGMNPQTHRWGIFFRVACGAAPGGSSSVAIGIRSGATRIGLGFAGAQANWQYVRGNPGAVANITSMAKAIDATGNQWLTMYVGNFDLVNVKANIDVRGGAADVTCEAVGSLPTSQTSGEILVGSGTTDTLYVRNIIFMTELTPTGL